MRSAEDDRRVCTLVDAAGREIGPILSYWTEPGSQRARFAAVRAREPAPRTLVVPLEGGRFDAERRVLRVPYARDIVLGAPVAEADAPLSQELAEAARSHYLGKAAPEELPLYHEVARASKRVVSAGGVRLRKVVRREIVHVPVEVLREEYVLEPVWSADDTLPGEGTDLPREAFREGSVVLPRFQEEPVIERTTELLEVVRAARHEETERALVAAEVRREDVEVDRDPR